MAYKENLTIYIDRKKHALIIWKKFDESLKERNNNINADLATLVILPVNNHSRSTKYKSS